MLVDEGFGWGARMSMSRNKQLLRMRRRRNLHTRRRALVKLLTERPAGISIGALMMHPKLRMDAVEAIDAQRQGLKRRPR